MAVERFPKFTSAVPCEHIKTRLDVTTFPALDLTQIFTIIIYHYKGSIDVNAVNYHRRVPGVGKVK